MAAPATPDAELLTIDELARRTGITVRNIRFYTQRGLLPPPRLRGRTGLYDAAHQARLELVSELSALGFTLSAIESHLERIPESAGEAELALQRAVLTPWVSEQVDELDRRDLDRRAGRPLAEADVQALEALGIVSRVEGERVHVISGASLTAGLAMLDSGLPITLWLRSQAIIEKHAAAMAEELMEMFQEEVLQPYRDRGRPAEERTRLAAALGQLKPITVRALLTSFGRAINRTIRDRAS